MAARIELDLRIGAAFTRLQTLQLQTVVAALKEKVISYGKLLLIIDTSKPTDKLGSCQFPTLGFVVDRYLRVQNFKPETFWGIKVILSREGKKVNFLWKRVHLFDRAVVTMMLERCLVAKQAKVTKVNQKPTSKWRPLPLTTVDLQMMGSRFLRLDSQTIMKVGNHFCIGCRWYLTSSKVAEALYTKGFISYPRTETDQFDKAIDLKKLVEKQYPDSSWGQYARE